MTAKRSQDYRSSIVGVAVFSCLVLCVFYSQEANAAEEVDFLRMKDGFKATYFARNLTFGPRCMVLGNKGTLFVGERIPGGSLYAIKFDYKDYQITQIRTIATNLFNPAALVFRNGSLYLGATDKIYRWDDIENQLEDVPPPKVLFEFPETSVFHPVRYITFSPLDAEGNTIYVNIGAPCDECVAPDPWGNMYAIDINSKKPKMTLVARGIRTIVGLDWHPITNELYFSENGPAPWNGVEDLVNPPDEINILSLDTINSGEIPDYGYPYCYGYNRPNPTYLPVGSCWNRTSAYFELGAHVAPLGVKFYTGDNFPPAFKHNLLIAEHAPHVKNSKSYPRPFNLTIGHRVTYLNFDILDANGKPYYDTLAEGWRITNIDPHNEDIIGAPVDFLHLPDGTILVSDDLHKAIYRFEYVGGYHKKDKDTADKTQYMVSGIVSGLLAGLALKELTMFLVKKIKSRWTKDQDKESSQGLPQILNDEEEGL